MMEESSLVRKFCDVCVEFVTWRKKCEKGRALFKTLINNFLDKAALKVRN